MRQKPIGNYIVDFYCSKLKLVIEIDGESHDGRFQYDMERKKILESMGLTVLRFDDVDVKKNVESVLMEIEGWVKDRDNNPLTNSPLEKGTVSINSPLIKGVVSINSPLIKGDKGGCDLKTLKTFSEQTDNPLTPFSKGE